MGVANTKAFPKQLDKDINKMFFDSYTEYEPEYTKIAKISKAPAGNHYTEAEISGLGAFRPIGEGEGVSFDLPVEGHEKTVYYDKFGLGFQVTEEMVADDLQGKIIQMPKKLAKSGRYKFETAFFDLFNNGFVTTYHTAWDGKAIFTTDHTTLKSGDTINNDLTAASLSETSLQAMFEYFDTLVDESGNPLMMKPKILLYPTELRWTAEQLMKARGAVDSMDNNLNLLNPENGAVANYITHMSRFLTSSTAYFLLAEERDCRMLVKKDVTMESSDDFSTGNRLYKATSRFVSFVNDYKGMVGNAGA